MEITISINQSELDSTSLTILKDCLGIYDQDEVNLALIKLCKSAFMEYIKMFRERGLPNRADEVKQERLYHLLLYYFEDRIPQESEISTIFQITLTQSRTLLRNTSSRFRTKIISFLSNTLFGILNGAKFNRETNKYELTILSKIFLEEFNTTINIKGPGLSILKKVKNSASRFECSEDTYNLLIENYGIYE